MKRKVSNRISQVLYLAFLLTCFMANSARSQEAGTAGPSSIPETEIASLQAELVEQSKETSSTSKRRACKSIVRHGEGLIDDFPNAPNRFRILAIMLDSQKRLLRLENTERNRDDIFETCSKLAEAPDEYAEFRLEADLLLSERDLSLKGADLKERTEALKALIQRYRDTPGEAKSLMIAALIAPKLEAFDLERELIGTMTERFPGDPVVIGWRRHNLGVTEFDVLFTGTYTRADGVSISFPIDVMGHTYLIYFWSKETPGIEERLAEVKALQALCPGQLEVFSFNLDDLPDAGENILRALDLDWPAMHLPGGRMNQAYRAYASRDPLGIRVNAHGHAFLHPPAVSALVEDMRLGRDLDDTRYLAQLQSLFIGDFLVSAAELKTKASNIADSVPAETLDAIQACFTAAPMRYRLTGAQALANYQKAEKLCRDAIAQHPRASDLWLVRNRRIIALLGMWNLATEPKHLEEAAREARTALEATLPPGANVVPQCCLAKETLRQGDQDPESVLSAMIEATGGTNAPASASAAAAILAMDVINRDLHNQYREMLLKTDTKNPAMWPVLSFLRDQNHRFRLFKANYYLPPSKARRVVRSALRRNAADLDTIADSNQQLKAEFNTLTGSKFSLTNDEIDKLTFLVFMEPPVDESSAAMQNEIITYAQELADTHLRKGIEVVAAFLCEDPDTVRTLVEKNEWRCPTVLLPDGLENPLVQQLGILWADRIPNIALLRGDGTVAWTLSGLVHPQLKSEGDNELRHVITLAMKSNIELHEMGLSLEALKKGDYEQAVQHFSGPFPLPEKFHPNGWFPPRLHGRAVAYVGLKNWEAALTDIDAAIEAHHTVYNYGRPCECHRAAKMLHIKAAILEQLGKTEEAEATMQQAAAATSIHPSSRYGHFHDQFNALHLQIRN